MSVDKTSIGLARRERTGSQKRAIGHRNYARMLPGRPIGLHGGNIPPGTFSGDIACMSMEDSYCDMWDRCEIIDARTRSLFNVSLMVGVGNIGNQFEIEWHIGGAVFNGVTIAELEALLVHARPYVGSPASAWALQTAMAVFEKHKLLKEPLPDTDLARRERKGSEKRAIAREVLREMDPGSALLKIPEDEMSKDIFAPELDYMTLESVYFDLWARTEVLDRRNRSVVTLGLIMALPNHAALREFIPVALNNGITIPELEEFVYQSATYLGTVSGAALRKTIGDALKELAPPAVASTP